MEPMSLCQSNTEILAVPLAALKIKEGYDQVLKRP